MANQWEEFGSEAFSWSPGAHCGDRRAAGKPHADFAQREGRFFRLGLFDGEWWCDMHWYVQSVSQGSLLCAWPILIIHWLSWIAAGGGCAETFVLHWTGSIRPASHWGIRGNRGFTINGWKYGWCGWWFWRWVEVLNFLDDLRSTRKSLGGSLSRR